MRKKRTVKEVDVVWRWLYQFQYTFSKMEKLSELLTVLSRLINSVRVDRNYEFRKIELSNIKSRNVTNVSCSAFNGGDIIE